MRSLPELVEFIRVSCKNQGSSITKMEKDLKFANGTVGKWANGKRYPPKDKLLLVSDFLRISIEELMGEEQKEKPSTPEGVDLSSLSPEDAELVRRILGASEAKKNAIRELL
jgi:transcriptional regulator with XRE-family HTH domain|nr:MAG TPA: Regulatory protein [Caudoviricetes sp.]DAT48905.1 MAG TPA: Regulatory protein [Caudoviricetes sp.]